MILKNIPIHNLKLPLGSTFKIYETMSLFELQLVKNNND